MTAREIIFLPEARLETEEAYRWYEGKRLGLGEELLLVIDAAIEQIQRSPEVGPIVHRNVRRVLTRRFPYGIYYIVESSRLVVVAVFHGRRDPRDLQKRQ